jgi:hypothetical protein
LDKFFCIKITPIIQFKYFLENAKQYRYFYTVENAISALTAHPFHFRPVTVGPSRRFGPLAARGGRARDGRRAPRPQPGPGSPIRPVSAPPRPPASISAIHLDRTAQRRSRPNKTRRRRAPRPNPNLFNLLSLSRETERRHGGRGAPRRPAPERRDGAAARLLAGVRAPLGVSAPPSSGFTVVPDPLSPRRRRSGLGSVPHAVERRCEYSAAHGGDLRPEEVRDPPPF